MIEFLKTHYFLAIYLITWVVAMIQYRRYVDTPLNLFPILITYTFLNELLGYLILENDKFQFFDNPNIGSQNVIVYNIYSLLFYLYFYWVYWKVLQQEKIKKLVFYGSLVFILVFSFSTFFQSIIRTSLFYAEAFGSFFLVFCTLLYFNQKNKTTTTLQKHNLMYWVSLGLFIFNIYFPAHQLFGHLNYEFYAQNNMRAILRIIIVLMYSFFIIGFVLGRKRSFG